MCSTTTEYALEGELKILLLISYKANQTPTYESMPNQTPDKDTPLTILHSNLLGPIVRPIISPAPLHPLAP